MCSYVPWLRHKAYLTSFHSYSFRPETLTCRPGQNTSTCLTGDQIFALHRIYSTYYEANQTYIFASYYPGGETGFFDGLVGNSTFQLGLNYFQYFVLK